MPVIYQIVEILPKDKQTGIKEARVYLDPFPTEEEAKARIESLKKERPKSRFKKVKVVVP